ncbi:MAG: hypothetical protein JSW07_06570 [bacterium]|nr:MAG: hypothetical protein JSW07_06570 [bacterium]
MDGIIRDIYSQYDRSEAVLILKCRTVNEARKLIETLPLVKEGLIEFEMIPLRARPGISRLFE